MGRITWVASRRGRANPDGVAAQGIFVIQSSERHRARPASRPVDLGKGTRGMDGMNRMTKLTNAAAQWFVQAA
jgi:hypothetical protein